MTSVIAEGSSIRGTSTIEKLGARAAASGVDGTWRVDGTTNAVTSGSMDSMVELRALGGSGSRRARKRGALRQLNDELRPNWLF